MPKGGPTSHIYFSQRLRLHYVDWGNQDAPTLLMVHGGRDHCRNCVRVPRAPGRALAIHRWRPVHARPPPIGSAPPASFRVGDQGTFGVACDWRGVDTRTRWGEHSTDPRRRMALATHGRSPRPSQQKPLPVERLQVVSPPRV